MQTLGPWIRRVLAALVVAATIVLARQGPEFMLLSLPAVVLIAVLLLPDLARPFTWLIDWIFGTLPGSGDKPPLDLRLARFYEQEERYEEAIAEYERISGLYPKVVEPYERMLHLSVQVGGDLNDLEVVYQRGQRHLKDDQMLEALRDAYEEARLQVRPR